jgi:hypothetical protein
MIEVVVGLLKREFSLVFRHSFKVSVVILGEVDLSVFPLPFLCGPQYHLKRMYEFKIMCKGEPRVKGRPCAEVPCHLIPCSEEVFGVKDLMGEGDAGASP